MTEELYQEHILEHFECPYHKGHLENPTITHRDKNPLCGDVVQLQLRIDERNQVVDAWFDGHGCAISQAAASILCEQIEGKSLDEIRDMQARDMLDLLQVQLTATRQKCGLLGFRVLKTIVYTLDEERESAATTHTTQQSS